MDDQHNHTAHVQVLKLIINVFFLQFIFKYAEWKDKRRNYRFPVALSSETIYNNALKLMNNVAGVMITSSMSCWNLLVSNAQADVHG